MSYTKRAVEVFSALDFAGFMRRVLNGDAQIWGTEVENRVNQLAGIVSGNIQHKTAARVATVTNASISDGLEEGDTIDGVVLVAGDRVLVKNHINAHLTGIYIVPSSGAASRSSDADSGSELTSAAVFITDGATNRGRTYYQTVSPSTVGVTNLNWIMLEEFDYSHVIGERGWSPLIRVVSDGDRRVHELYDWIDGQGLPPTATGYLSSSGLTSDISLATDIRGPQGASGDGTGDMLKSVYDPKNFELDVFERASMAFYDSKEQAEAAFIRADVPYITTASYYTGRGKGGARYRRMSFTPSAFYGRFQSADGAWWDIDIDQPTFYHFGAKADGSDDTQAIMDSLQWHRGAGGFRPFIRCGGGVFSCTQLLLNSFRGINIIGEGTIDPILNNAKTRIQLLPIGDPDEDNVLGLLRIRSCANINFKGIQFHVGGNTELDHLVYFEANAMGVGGGLNEFSNNFITFEDCVFSAPRTNPCADATIWLKSCNQTTFNRCHLDGNRVALRLGRDYDFTPVPTPVAISIASPGVFTRVGHGLPAGRKFRLTTTGSLPTGLAINTDYYVLEDGLTADTFRASLTPGGAAVDTSGTQSGTQSYHAVTFGDGRCHSTILETCYIRGDIDRQRCRFNYFLNNQLYTTTDTLGTGSGVCPQFTISGNADAQCEYIINNLTDVSDITVYTTTWFTGGTSDLSGEVFAFGNQLSGCRTGFVINRGTATIKGNRFIASGPTATFKAVVINSNAGYVDASSNPWGNWINRNASSVLAYAIEDNRSTSAGNRVLNGVKSSDTLISVPNGTWASYMQNASAVFPGGMVRFEYDIQIQNGADPANYSSRVTIDGSAVSGTQRRVTAGDASQYVGLTCSFVAYVPPSVGAVAVAVQVAQNTGTAKGTVLGNNQAACTANIEHYN